MYEMIVGMKIKISIYDNICIAKMVEISYNQIKGENEILSKNILNRPDLKSLA